MFLGFLCLVDDESVWRIIVSRDEMSAVVRHFHSSLGGLGNEKLRLVISTFYCGFGNDTVTV